MRHRGTATEIVVGKKWKTHLCYFCFYNFLFAVYTAGTLTETHGCSAEPWSMLETQARPTGPSLGYTLCLPLKSESKALLTNPPKHNVDGPPARQTKRCLTGVRSVPPLALKNGPLPPRVVYHPTVSTAALLRVEVRLMLCTSRSLTFLKSDDTRYSERSLRVGIVPSGSAS